MDGMTLTRGALVDLLQARRDNDVYVAVPLETGGHNRFAVRSVRYDPGTDTIEIVTEPDLNGGAS